MRTVVALVALAACTSPEDEPSGPGVAMTKNGYVRGVREGDVYAWRGMPYAAAPVGDLRWRVPQPLQPWDGVRDASAFGPGCVEISTAGQLLGGSEDCLFVNVWARAEPAARLPVLMFIHGGFALSGSSTSVIAGERLYDGAYVAAYGPAVVVTLNYRLGALGFFTSPALAAEAGTTGSGNYAHHDQLAAVRWVHENIAAFGGDPNRVMVFGESAGGASTCVLYASPQAAGLFSAALIQSGGCGAKPAARADELSARLVTGAGCTGAADVLACLREQPADSIAVAASIDLATSNTDRWSSSIDGDLIPESPLTAIAAGRHNHIPMIIGTTSNEFSTLVGNFLRTPITTDEEYRAAVARMFPNGTAQILAQYPSSAYPSPLQALIALTSDGVMTCPTRRIARAAVAAQSEPVRRYVFAHTFSNGPLQRFGAGHALELPFVFHNLALAGFVASPDELALSDAMISYWVRFAASGDPNGAGAPVWPVYAAPSDPAIVLDTPITETAGVRTSQCDFWDP